MLPLAGVCRTNTAGEAMSAAPHQLHSIVQETLLWHSKQKVQPSRSMGLCDKIHNDSSSSGVHCLLLTLQEATDIYKALLLDNRELLALNMYVALCYAKLDYYDVSQEILQVCMVLTVASAPVQGILHVCSKLIFTIGLLAAARDVCTAYDCPGRSSGSRAICVCDVR